MGEESVYKWVSVCIFVIFTQTGICEATRTHDSNWNFHLPLTTSNPGKELGHFVMEIYTHLVKHPDKQKEQDLAGSGSAPHLSRSLGQ